MPDFPESGGAAHPAVVFTEEAEAVRGILSVLEDPGHRRFLLCGHERPDGDCIGSLAALYWLLSARGREVRLYFHGSFVDNLMEFLPEGEVPDEAFPEDYRPDVTVCVDVSSHDRVTESFLDQMQGVVVNIDHHPSNPIFGDLNWVDEHYAATCEMLFALLAAREEAWTPAIARCLYLGLMTDTGGFRYRNTTARVLERAAALARQGADPHGLADAIFGNQKPETVRIASMVMANLRMDCGGALAIGEIRRELMEANGGDENEPDNLSGEMRGLRGVRVAALLRETAEGGLRASLRSDGSVDVSVVAQGLGGGGHRAAAGLSLDGPYEAARERLLDALRPAMQC